MALARTDLLGQAFAEDSPGTGAGTSTAFTPPDNSLLVVAHMVMLDVTNTDPTPSMSISGGGWTYTSQVTATASGSYSIGLVIWTAPVTTGASMQLSLDCGALDVWVLCVSVVAYTGYDTGTPIGGTASGSDTSTPDGAQNITLSAAPTVDDEIFAASIADKESVGTTPGSGWTEVHDVHSGGSGGLESEVETGVTSTSVDWVDVHTGTGGIFKWAGAAVVVKAGAAAAPAALTGPDFGPGPNPFAPDSFRGTSWLGIPAGADANNFDAVAFGFVAPFALGSASRDTAAISVDHVAPYALGAGSRDAAAVALDPVAPYALGAASHNTDAIALDPVAPTARPTGAHDVSAIGSDDVAPAGYGGTATHDVSAVSAVYVAAWANGFITGVNDVNAVAFCSVAPWAVPLASHDPAAVALAAVAPYATGAALHSVTPAVAVYAAPAEYAAALHSATTEAVNAAVATGLITASRTASVTAVAYVAPSPAGTATPNVAGVSVINIAVMIKGRLGDEIVIGPFCHTIHASRPGTVQGARPGTVGASRPGTITARP